jgi:hypothetical protein
MFFRAFSRAISISFKQRADISGFPEKQKSGARISDVWDGMTIVNSVNRRFART